MPVLTGIIPMKYVIAYDNVTWNRTVGLIRVSWKKLYVYWWKKKKKDTKWMQHLSGKVLYPKKTSVFIEISVERSTLDRRT